VIVLALLVQIQCYEKSTHAASERKLAVELADGGTSTTTPRLANLRQWQQLVKDNSAVGSTSPPYCEDDDGQIGGDDAGLYRDDTDEDDSESDDESDEGDSDAHIVMWPLGDSPMSFSAEERATETVRLNSLINGLGMLEMQDANDNAEAGAPREVVQPATEQQWKDAVKAAGGKRQVTSFEILGTEGSSNQVRRTQDVASCRSNVGC
jgi:hypothetical protein